MCTEGALPYNSTSFPNQLRHLNQNDAALDANTYYPLIKLNCSPQMRLLVCGVYFPQCDTTVRKPVCRSVCEQAKAGCAPLMARFGQQWPDALDCNQFADKDDDHSCWT